MCHVWEEVKDFVILAVIYSSFVELSYYGIVVGLLKLLCFEWYLCRMFYNEKKYLFTPENFRVAG